MGSQLPDASLPDLGAADLADRWDLAVQPDPLQCPVGVADGCCPSPRYGGSDPDCPSLACMKLDRTTPIELDAPIDSAGQVAMTWLGRELALAWTESENGPSGPKGFVVFQRRGPDGALTYGSMRREAPTGIVTLFAGPTALDYHPGQKKFVMAVTPYASRYGAIGMDRDGVPLWHTFLGSLCNTLPMASDVYIAGDEAIVAQQNYTCAGSTQEPRVDFLGLDGKARPEVMLGDGARPGNTGHAVYSYDPAGRRLFAVYDRGYEATVQGRYVDLTTKMAQPSFELLPHSSAPNYERLGLAFDGKRHGILVERRVSYAGYTQSFGIYESGTGWVGTATPLSSAGAIFTPSVIWTGQGYLVATTRFQGPNWPSELDKYSVEVFSLAADGSLREIVAIPGAAIFPRLLWAGGRVALSWVRVRDGKHTHMLQYLSCP